MILFQGSRSEDSSSYRWSERTNWCSCFCHESRSQSKLVHAWRISWSYLRIHRTPLSEHSNGEKSFEPTWPSVWFDRPSACACACSYFQEEIRDGTLSYAALQRRIQLVQSVKLVVEPWPWSLLHKSKTMSLFHVKLFSARLVLELDDNALALCDTSPRLSPFPYFTAAEHIYGSQSFCLSSVEEDSGEEVPCERKNLWWRQTQQLLIWLRSRAPFEPTWLEPKLIVWAARFWCFEVLFLHV